MHLPLLAHHNSLPSSVGLRQTIICHFCQTGRTSTNYSLPIWIKQQITILPQTWIKRKGIWYMWPWESAWSPRAPPLLAHVMPNHCLVSHLNYIHLLKHTGCIKYCKLIPHLTLNLRFVCLLWGEVTPQSLFLCVTTNPLSHQYKNWHSFQ